MESKKAIEELLVTVENANLDELFNSFINEEDSDKKWCSNHYILTL